MKGSNIGILAMSMAAPSPDGRFEGHWVLLAMVSCHVSGLFFLPMMPLLFGALAQQFSIDPINLGAIGSLQLSCTAIGAIFLTRLGARYSVRVIVLCAIVGELMINLGCILSDSITTITLLRGVSGLTEGMLLAGASAGAAISRKTEHFFVNYTVALAMLAVTGLSLGAGAIQAYGYAAGFALFVVINLICLVLIYRGFPIFMIERNFGNADPISGPNFSTRLVPLFAMGLFGAALAGTQTFIGRLGDLHGGSIQAIGMALSAGWVLAVGTPFFILPLVRRWGGLLVLLGAYLFISMVAVALSITESFPLFLLAASLFTPAALFIEPLQFGVLGSIDPGGRLAAFGPAAISFGSGVGPVLAGAMVAYGGLRAVGVLGSVLLALSLAIFLPAAQKAYRGIAQ